MSAASSNELKELLTALDYYRANFRGPKMPPLELSNFYDLFPGTDEAECEDRWPNVYSPGVYLIFDVNKRVIYIGKASMNSWFGARLGTYFKLGPDKSCVVLDADKWNGDPRFVAVIPMQEDFRFEAPALEEFLITKLQPIDNKVGITRRPT